MHDRFARAHLGLHRRHRRLFAKPGLLLLLLPAAPVEAHDLRRGFLDTAAVPVDCGLPLFVRPVDQVPYVVGEVGRVGVDAVALGLLK